MKKTSFIIIIIAFNFITAFSQEVKNEVVNDTLYKPNYPEGIYGTKSDFNRRKPSEKINVTPKTIMGWKRLVLTEIVHNCYFYYTESNQRVADAFAISYKGNLYFKIEAILANRNKTDRAQDCDFRDSFVRVILGGNNYFYTEAQIGNAWAKALGAQGGAIGSVVGSIIERNTVYGKGIVWDFKNKEFNIFKNCEDYNDFITDKNKDDIQDCAKNQPDVLKIRKAIDKIK